MKVLKKIFIPLFITFGIAFIIFLVWNTDRNPVKAQASLLKFDEGYGNATKDVQNIASGTIAGATWVNEDLCLSGKCLLFNGTNAYVNLGDNNNFDFSGSDNFTISLWFRHKPITSGTQVLLAKTNASAGYKIQMESDGDLTFAIDDDGTSFPEESVTTTEATYDDNLWHNVIAVKTGTTKLDLYIDGLLKGTHNIATATGSLANSSNLYIGVDGNGSSNFYQGYIDEINIFTSTTGETATSIKKLSIKGAGPDGSSAVFGNYQTYLSDGLVGYWKMDEASWSGAVDEVVDTSGNGNHGQTANSPSIGSGKFGNGGIFDGTDDTISMGDKDTLDLRTGGLTAFAWIKLNTTANHDIIVEKGGSSAGAAGYWFGMTTTGNLDLNISDGATFILNNAQSNKSVGDGTWHHVGFIWDPTRGAQFIIDGNLDSFYPVTTQTDINGAAAFRIGGYSASTYTASGTIDEVRIYNKALSANLISQIYAWAPGPVGYWKMDEGRGSTTVDSSGNGFDGTFSNQGVTWTHGKFGSGTHFSGGADSTSNLDYVRINDDDKFSVLTTNQLTIEGWAIFDTVGKQQMLVSKRYYSGNQYEWSIGIQNGGRFDCNITQSSGPSYLHPMSAATNLANINTWYHLACVIDNNIPRADLYVNGVLVGSATVASGSIINGTSQVQIGADKNGDNHLAGIADEVKIYNYTRNSKQIVEDMNGGHPAPGSPVGSALLHYKFDEGNGTTVHDEGASRSYTGTLAGVDLPSWTNNGKFEKAVTFPTSQSYVNATDIAALDGLSQMTISLWINPSTLNNFSRIIEKDDGVNQNSFQIQLTNPATELYFDVSSLLTNFDTNYYTTTNANLVTGSWQHLVFVYDGTQVNNSDRIKIYKNGQKLLGSVTGTIPATLTSGSTTPLRIGNSGTNNGTPGSYDEVKIYTAALTQDQVNVEYNQGKSESFGANSNTSTGTPMQSASGKYCVPGDSSTCTGPVAEWDFDENSGTTTKDTSGNNLTLNKFGSSSWSQGKFGSGLITSSTGGGITISDPGGTWDFSNGGLDASTSSFSISMWIKPDPLTNHSMSLIYKGAGDVTSSGYWLWWDYGNSRLALDTSDGVARNYYYSSTVTWDGKWHYITVTLARSGSTDTGKIYLDGKLLSSQDDPDIINNSLNSTIAFSIGGIGVNYQYVGLLDETRVYNYVRTPAQIAWEYNRGAPVAWYKFDECTGQVIHNSTVNANGTGVGMDGTLTITSGGGGSQDSTGNCSSGIATEAWNNGTSGKYSASMNFDGANDYASVPSFTLTGRQATYSVWINLTDYSDWRALVRNTGNPATPQLYMYVSKVGQSDAGKLMVYFADDNPAETNSVIPLGVWTHLTAVYDGDNTNIKIYINGKLDTNFTTGNNNFNFTGINIGTQATPATEFFKGKMDDIKVFNYSLTPTQVKTLYNQNSSVQF